MASHIPDFYSSILEASERGELWGVFNDHVSFVQLELEFNPPLEN
mgnify:CR=1 FL=1